MIIGLLNQKGGVGKTTLAISLAHALSNSKTKKVLLVDSDPQQSALNWSQVKDSSPSFSVIGLATKTIHRDLPEISKNYDHVIIDSPPRVTDIARSVILASEIILIPCTPCVFSVWAFEETVNLIEEASVFKPNIKHAILINRKSTKTLISKSLIKTIKESEIRMMKTMISERVVFASASLQGKTIFEMQKNDDSKIKAMQEIKKLIRELKGMSNE
jgi:chromosome partitioning protein